MDKGLLSIFSETDFRKPIGDTVYSLADIVSLGYVMNKSTGERYARAVLGDGTALIKTVPSGNVKPELEYVIPAYKSTSRRNEIIRELAEDPDLTQEMIACMMDISQSTVSNVMRR
ncbi:MAG: hypothetical protein K6E34_11790 [Lachnospiraceae bacterium]|nr:hypothetical protein [Lachnospiraceae bacterium]